MVGRVDLHGGADLRAIPNVHLDHIEDHAVEVEKHARSKPYVEAIVAEERGADLRAFADVTKSLEQELPAAGRRRRVVAREPVRRRCELGLDFRIAGAIE